MKILYLVLIAIFCFGLLIVGNKRTKESFLFTLGIGGAVNANFFHAGTYPIQLGNLYFGIDSIIYGIAIFCVILIFLEKDKKSAYSLGVSIISAIIFSAIVQLVAGFINNGFNNAVDWQLFASFIASALGSAIAIYVMILVMDKLKEKTNVYLLILIGTFVAIIINSTIYYSLNALIYGGVAENFVGILLASYIGKIFVAGLSLLVYFIRNKSNKKYKD